MIVVDIVLHLGRRRSDSYQKFKPVPSSSLRLDDTVIASPHGQPFSSDNLK